MLSCISFSTSFLSFIFGTGVGQFTGEYMRVHQGGYVALSNHLKEFFSKSIFPQGLQNIPVAGKLLFSHSLFFYLALVLAVVMWWFLYKTRTGLHLRAVGENPATADAAGINVTPSSSSTTISLSTVFAKSRIFCTGSGWIMPNFSTG